jgi:hypothetical protein
VVDTQGLLLKAKVLPAGLHDRPAAELVLAGWGEQRPGIRLLGADTAYRGLADWLAGTLGWSLAITRHGWTGARVWVAAAARAPVRVSGAPAQRGGGENLRLAGPQSVAVEGRRAAVRDDRDLDRPR